VIFKPNGLTPGSELSVGKNFKIAGRIKEKESNGVDRE